MKRTFFITLFSALILVANLSFASYSTVTMEVVDEPICTIQFTENSKFEKRLISKDLNNKEVTLQLQVTNEEEDFKPTGEIMLVIDNSKSMNDTVNNSTSTRKDLVFNSARTLITNLLQDNTKLKIGIVRFSTNTDMSKEATADDASLVSELSNDVSTLTNAISNIETDGPRTDLQAGLNLASQHFSSEQNNKYMIVLTDGIPNVSLGHNNPYYSDETIDATKNELQSVEKDGIKLITMLTGITDDYTISSDYTPNEIIEKIFGTPENPTSGTFYYISDNEIEKTITTDIYNDLLPISKSLKDITIVDYFPAEIVNNFDFAYVSNANIGNISATIDTSNNSITWTIPELASGQTATVQYKLKLKQNFDSAIVGKILNTNQKVDATYTDFDNIKQDKTSDVSPKLKLTEPPVVLPKAGKTALIVFIALAGVVGLYSLSKILIINKKIK